MGKTFFVYVLGALLVLSGICASSSLKRKASDKLIEDEGRGKRPTVKVIWTSDDEMGEFAVMPPNTPTGTVSSCEYEDSHVNNPEIASNPILISTIQPLLQIDGYGMVPTTRSDMFVFKHDRITPILLVQILNGELKVTSNDPGLSHFLLFVPPGSNLVAMLIPNLHPITLPTLNRVYLVSSRNPVAIGFAQTILSLIDRRDINQLYQTCGVEFVFQLTP